MNSYVVSSLELLTNVFVSILYSSARTHTRQGHTCLSAVIRMLQVYTYGGEKTTLFETGFLLFSNVWARLIGLWTSTDSHVSVFHLPKGLLGLQIRGFDMNSVIWTQLFTLAQQVFYPLLCFPKHLDDFLYDHRLSFLKKFSRSVIS